MNRVHRIYCRSRPWRRTVQGLLPWALDGLVLEGASVLELGPGPGLTTDWLLPRVGSLTCVEYDEDAALALARRRPEADVRHADATALPFAPDSFDAVLCFTMLHHLPSAAAQDRLLTEAARVLRPHGVLAGSDSRWGPLFALAHVGDTCTPVAPEGFAARLEGAGFEAVETATRRDALRFRALRPSR
jgi:SAM-dependent methyltransferase